MPLRVAAVGALLLALVLPSAAAAATPQTNLPDIEDEVMCTVCGTPLEQSESPQANRERALIRKLIAEGKTKDEIKDALVAQYGSEVLATPSGSGFDLFAWVVPGLAIGLALLALIYLAWRLQRRSRPAAPAPTIEPADSSRLDEDMKRYDL
jgi:cytochrome c-type biogenesis protein CcmH